MIATEKGWNLYVGGNGGPTHRLQRTSTWIDSLDGGLDRVRKVVVDDALGLGVELEAELARHVDTYFDEWRATLDDPEKLARFVSFVNAPGVPDPTISFVTECGQVAPAVTEEPVLLAGAAIPVGAP
ncbi:MAG: hypothetical protein ACXWW7_12185 [Nocardioides sp.]